MRRGRSTPSLPTSSLPTGWAGLALRSDTAWAYFKNDKKQKQKKSSGRVCLQTGVVHGGAPVSITPYDYHPSDIYSNLLHHRTSRGNSPFHFSGITGADFGPGMYDAGFGCLTKILSISQDRAIGWLLRADDRRSSHTENCGI